MVVRCKYIKVFGKIQIFYRKILEKLMFKDKGALFVVLLFWLRICVCKYLQADIHSIGTLRGFLQVPARNAIRMVCVSWMFPPFGMSHVPVF
jgi:hypothetical protein